MSSKNTYTSKIEVPVYAGWICEKCGEKNFSVGFIQCKRQANTSHFRKSKNEEEKKRADQEVQKWWKCHAMGIMFEPNHSANAMQNDFVLYSTTCTKCGKRPRWDKGMRYLLWGIPSLWAVVISGVGLLAGGTGVLWWLVFLTSLSGTIAAFISEPMYKRMMEKLPKEYAPVIGTSNEEFAEYVKKYDKSIPTPNEVIEILDKYQMRTTEDGNAFKASKRLPKV